MRLIAKGLRNREGSLKCNTNHTVVASSSGIHYRYRQRLLKNHFTPSATVSLIEDCDRALRPASAFAR